MNNINNDSTTYGSSFRSIYRPVTNNNVDFSKILRQVLEKRDELINKRKLSKNKNS